MAAMPEPLHSLAASIYRWREATADDGLRPHLGASLIGHPCGRYLWLTFRWAARPSWEGRMLRLFDRGQREEAVIVTELRGIGAEVSECQPNGDQWRVSACGGHFGGSLDGVARRLPGGSEINWELLEFKTHNAKSFKEVADKGVEKAKWQHYCQMQTYMALTGMTRANYIAVCKDDDSIYHERIHADAKTGRDMLDRAQSVIFAGEPLPKISDRPDWYQCKTCHYHGQCHGTEAPMPNCRTCAHVTPLEDSTWHCARYDAGNIPLEHQRKGCGCHVLHPDLVPWPMQDSPNRWEAVYLIDGVPVRNGEGDANVYTSREILEKTS
jgi:hypothetical protein